MKNVPAKFTIPGLKTEACKVFLICSFATVKKFFLIGQITLTLLQ